MAKGTRRALEVAAQQAGNILYNVAQFDRPLTEAEKHSCQTTRDALDKALAASRKKNR